MAAPLSIDDARACAESFAARRKRFPDESEVTALMVVLLNFGDRFTAVACIGGEWSGTKAAVAHLGDRLPVCPNGHPLLEHGRRLGLGLVELPDHR